MAHVPPSKRNVFTAIWYKIKNEKTLKHTKKFLLEAVQEPGFTGILLVHTLPFFSH